VTSVAANKKATMFRLEESVRSAWLEWGKQTVMMVIGAGLAAAS
jgi:hypothetical protein